MLADWRRLFICVGLVSPQIFMIHYPCSILQRHFRFVLYRLSHTAFLVFQSLFDADCISNWVFWLKAACGPGLTFARPPKRKACALEEPIPPPSIAFSFFQCVSYTFCFPFFDKTRQDIVQLCSPDVTN